MVLNFCRHVCRIGCNFEAEKILVRRWANRQAHVANRVVYFRNRCDCRIAKGLIGLEIAVVVANEVAAVAVWLVWASIGANGVVAFEFTDFLSSGVGDALVAIGTARVVETTAKWRSAEVWIVRIARSEECTACHR